MKPRTLIVRFQAPLTPSEPPPPPPATITTNLEPPATVTTYLEPPATATTNQEPPHHALKKETVENQHQNAYEWPTLEPPSIDPSPLSESLGKRMRKPKELHDQISTFIIRSRKRKSASKTKQVLYDSGAKPLSHKQEDGADEASNANTPIKSPTLIRAEEVQYSLGNEFPSFLKSMVRSNVTTCFWLGLPVPFCKKHLPRKNTQVVLENESGEQFEIKYIAEKTGLSAGWTKFVGEHKLLEGDVLIFQLIAPIKFKVYMIRTNDLDEVDGALSLLNLDSLTKQLDAEGVAALNVKNKKKRSKSLPLNVVQKRKKKEGSSGSAIVAAGVPGEQSSNDSDEVASEVLEGAKFHPAVITRFRDIKRYEEFHIIVNGVCIDSELPEHIRRKYYELCCIKNSFLHERLLPSLYCKLASGLIFELVNIADAIKCCKITTPRKELDVWDKSLKSFELLGMNVGFLRGRLRRLVSLSFDSEGAAETKRYWEMKTERARCEGEIRSLEEKLEGLKEVSERNDADIELMKAGAESYELMFQEQVNAPF